MIGGGCGDGCFSVIGGRWLVVGSCCQWLVGVAGCGCLWLVGKGFWLLLCLIVGGRWFMVGGWGGRCLCLGVGSEG